MSSRSAGERRAFDQFDDEEFDDFFRNDLRRDNSFPGRQPRSVFRSKFDDSRPSSSGRFAEHLRNFSPSARKSGEDILNRLKDQLKKESDMFFNSSPDWEPKGADDTDDWARKGFGEMRSRHPMFRMPNWMSEDEDVSNLASRMSQAPHFSSMGRRPRPGRERRHSGGSAMSGTSEDDSVDGPHTDRSSQSSGGSFRHDSTPVTIPIRIEAEAPPGYQPAQSTSPRAQHLHEQQQQHPQELQHAPNGNQQPQTVPHMYTGELHKQPQYASRTTSAVDAIKQEEFPRDTRCSSAPPDVTDPANDQPPKFVSKINITPQNANDRPFSTSPVFNNVAKPFVSSHKQEKTPPIQEEQFCGSSNEHPITSQGPNFSVPSNQQFPQHQPQHYPEQQYSQQNPQQPQQHWGGTGPKSSVVRNIPIIFESRDEPVINSSTSSSRSPPHNQQNRPHPGLQRDLPFMNASYGFPSHGFSNAPPQDPFFNFQSGPSHMPNYHQPSHHQQPQHPHPSQQPHPTPEDAPAHSNQTNIPKSETHTSELPKDVKMEKISAIRQSITEYLEMAKNFEGCEKNKEFLYIDEMLTRALLQLDDIDPDGREDVRQTRRTLIKDINDTIAALEKRVTKAQEENSRIENTPSETPKPEEGTLKQTSLIENTKMEEDGNIIENETKEAAVIVEEMKFENTETADAAPENEIMEVDQCSNEQKTEIVDCSEQQPGQVKEEEVKENTENIAVAP